MIKIYGYIIKVLFPNNRDWKFVCEANNVKYTRYLTEDELEENPRWKPKVYETLKAAKLAINHYDCMNDYFWKAIGVQLQYNATGEILDFS